MREKIHCVTDSTPSRYWGVPFVAPIMMFRPIDCPSFHSMLSPRSWMSGFFMHDHCCSRRYHWYCIKIIRSLQLVIRRKFRIDSQCPHEVQRCYQRAGRKKSRKSYDYLYITVVQCTHQCWWHYSMTIGIKTE